MRRRPKPVIQDDGKPWDGTVPDWVLRFDRADDWPGYQPWEQWDSWWTAANEWADKRLPLGLFDPELMALMPEEPSRPWNEADI